MKDMAFYAKQYQNENRGKGTVSDVTDYSFKFTTIPKKDKEEPKSCIIMKSYFWEVGNE